MGRRASVKAVVHETWLYYRAWLGRWVRDWLGHLWITGILVGAVLSAAVLGVDWLRSSEAERDSMSLGRQAESFGLVFGAYVVLTGLWFLFRAPLKLQQLTWSEASEAVEERDALREDIRASREMNLSLENLGQDQRSQPLEDFPQEPAVFLSFGVWNYGAESYFTVELYSQTVGPAKVLDDDAYPRANVPLKWEAPHNLQPDRRIGKQNQAKIDFCFVLPQSRRIVFLKPGLGTHPKYKVLSYTADATTICGDLYFTVVGRDAWERYRFEINVDPAHPIAITGLDLMGSSETIGES